MFQSLAFSQPFSLMYTQFNYLYSFKLPVIVKNILAQRVQLSANILSSPIFSATRQVGTANNVLAVVLQEVVA